MGMEKTEEKRRRISSTIFALFLFSQTRIWVSFIGFTLFFGPILVKAWRVYYIFRSIKLKKKVNLQ